MCFNNAQNLYEVDFWFLGMGNFWGEKTQKITQKKPKTLAQHLQFLTDFARVYFKMYVLIVCNIWRNRFFNLGFFLGVKNCEKTPEIPKISFLCFSADFDEIWYKMFFWSPKTKSEVKFSKFWKGGPSGEGWGGGLGIPKNSPKLIPHPILTEIGNKWFFGLIKPNLMSIFWNHEKGARGGRGGGMWGHHQKIQYFCLSTDFVEIWYLFYGLLKTNLNSFFSKF